MHVFPCLIDVGRTKIRGLFGTDSIVLIWLKGMFKIIEHKVMHERRYISLTIDKMNPFE